MAESGTMAADETTVATKCISHGYDGSRTPQKDCTVCWEVFLGRSPHAVVRFRDLAGLKRTLEDSFRRLSTKALTVANTAIENEVAEIHDRVDQRLKDMRDEADEVLTRAKQRDLAGDPGKDRRGDREEAAGGSPKKQGFTPKKKKRGGS
jgi:hypothetical protein